MGLELLPTKAARLARAREAYEQGLYGRLEYRWMLETIEEVGDARLDDRPNAGKQTKGRPTAQAAVHTSADDRQRGRL
jgi:hypothetical protein